MIRLKSKTLYSTLFLLCGISFFHCIDCDCSFVKPFFQTKDMTLQHRQTNGSLSAPYSIDKPLPFERYASLRLRFDVDYLVQHCPHDYLPNFSQTALACSCNPPGWQGAKAERLESLHIVSLYDFNADIRRLDTLNAYFEISSQDFSFFLQEDLNAYLQRDTGLLSNSYFDLHLLEKSSANDTFQVKVIATLNDSVEYVVESSRLVFE